MKARIAIDKQRLEAICRRYKVRKLSLFGSVLRSDFGPLSDVDVLVDFAPGSRIGLFELYDMEYELSEIMGGRKVEVNTPRSLSKYFRDHVLAEAEVQYDQA